MLRCSAFAIFLSECYLSIAQRKMRIAGTKKIKALGMRIGAGSMGKPYNTKIKLTKTQNNLFLRCTRRGANLSQCLASHQTPKIQIKVMSNPTPKTYVSGEFNYLNFLLNVLIRGYPKKFYMYVPKPSH